MADRGTTAEACNNARFLGNQIDSIEMQEPGNIQFKDLLRQLLRHRRITETAKYADYSEAMAVWQLQILDLRPCIKELRSPTGCRFNLELSDPVEAVLAKLSNRLDTSAIAKDTGLQGWRRISGQYVVELRPSSNAASGNNPDLPTVRASVNAFSRLWFDLQSAHSLMVTDDIHG